MASYDAAGGTGKQRTFDFQAADQRAAELPARLTKADRQNLIRFARVPNVPILEGSKRRLARGDDIKHLLRVIDDRNQVYGIETVMADTGWSRQKAWRVMRGAEMLSLVNTRFKCGRTDVFTIPWNELGILVPDEKLRLISGRRQSGPTHNKRAPTKPATRPHSPIEAPPRGGANHGEPFIETTTNQDEWTAAVADVGQKLRIAGELAAKWQRAGKTPQKFRDDAAQAIATAELPKNLPLWRQGPLAAAADFLRHGRWPADGVVSLEEHAARQYRAAQRAKPTNEDVRNQIIRAGRDRGDEPEQINAKLEALGITELI
jgi:hypothetical protein